jgi:hypothetical protein
MAGLFLIGFYAFLKMAFQVIMECRPPLFDNMAAKDECLFLLVHFKVRLDLYRLEGFVLPFIVCVYAD